MVFRRHKKKKLFALFLLMAVGLFLFLLPMILKPLFEIALRKSGFPKAHVENLRYLADGFYIDKILLDPNGFTEIDDLEVRGRWTDLILRQHAERINIKTFILSGELDKQNRITIAGWDGKFGAGEKNQGGLPFRSLYLENMTADFDTPIGGIRVQGKMNLDTDQNRRQIISASLFSSQQQLTTTLNIKGEISPSGDFIGKADISDTSVNVAPIYVSRASGWVEFKPGSLAGQIVAGGIKYKNMPFEDANFVFDTAQNPAVSFKTKMTGHDLTISADLITQPQKNLKLYASAANFGELAALADIKNDVLSKSGPVNIKSAIRLADNFFPIGEIQTKEIKTSLAGGFLTIKPFIYYSDKPNSISLSFEKIQLSQFLNKDSSIKASGSMSGIIPLTYYGSDIGIQEGILRSDQAGTFEYNPAEIPQALQGADSRMDTIRKALSHYKYDTLELTLDGPLNGNLKTALHAKGTSPAFNDRPVNINLNLEGALASALTQALKPGTLGNRLNDSVAKEPK